jgi:hypothetical protein
MVCPWDWAKGTEERVSEMLKKKKALKNIYMLVWLVFRN